MMRQLALGAMIVSAWGCVREVKDHCANQDDPRAYCLQQHQVANCSTCIGDADGCTPNVVSDVCLPDGVTSVAEGASTDADATTMGSADVSESDDVADVSDGSVTTTAGTTTEPATDEGSSTTEPEPVCNNGMLEEGELCDGVDVGGADCMTYNLGQGDITCTANCTPNFADCTEMADCGNGIVEGAEDCDGENLNGATCESLPEFASGDLGCDECTYNTSQCEDCLMLLAPCERDAQCCDGSCNPLLGC